MCAEEARAEGYTREQRCIRTVVVCGLVWFVGPRDNHTHPKQTFCTRSRSEAEGALVSAGWIRTMSSIIPATCDSGRKESTRSGFLASLPMTPVALETEMAWYRMLSCEIMTPGARIGAPCTCRAVSNRPVRSLCGTAVARAKSTPGARAEAACAPPRGQRSTSTFRVARGAGRVDNGAAVPGLLVRDPLVHLQQNQSHTPVSLRSLFFVCALNRYGQTSASYRMSAQTAQPQPNVCTTPFCGVRFLHEPSRPRRRRQPRGTFPRCRP